VVGYLSERWSVNYRNDGRIKIGIRILGAPKSLLLALPRVMLKWCAIMAQKTLLGYVVENLAIYLCKFCLCNRFDFAKENKLAFFVLPPKMNSRNHQNHAT
jgi:hypothetical protein